MCFKFCLKTLSVEKESIFGARIWNSIPQSIRILSKHKFKDSLHQLLLHILELEDTYVDTPTLGTYTWERGMTCSSIYGNKNSNP